MKPTVGRIVHYTMRDDGEICAALIVDVLPSGDCTLKVFPVCHDERYIQAKYSEEPRVGRWHWPPREDE